MNYRCISCSNSIIIPDDNNNIIGIVCLKNNIDDSDPDFYNEYEWKDCLSYDADIDEGDNGQYK